MNKSGHSNIAVVDPSYGGNHGEPYLHMSDPSLATEHVQISIQGFWAYPFLGGRDHWIIAFESIFLAPFVSNLISWVPGRPQGRKVLAFDRPTGGWLVFAAGR